MIEPLSTDILDRMRADHFTAAAMQFNRCCYCGDSWPCDVRLLLAELDRREANPPRWQGHDHRSPVPHLAGVAYGLMGPSLESELTNAPRP